MLRKIFFIFSILIISNSAYASQKYKILIVNDSYDYIDIEARAGRCMSTWDNPSSPQRLYKGQEVIINIEDKNTVGDCHNSYKVAQWEISPYGKPFGYLVFNHFKENGAWKTVIENGGYDINYIISANCEVKNSVAKDCLNKKVEDVIDGGLITVIY